MTARLGGDLRGGGDLGVKGEGRRSMAVSRVRGRLWGRPRCGCGVGEWVRVVCMEEEGEEVEVGVEM